MKTRAWLSRVRGMLCPILLVCVVATNAGAEPPAKELTPAMIADFGGEKHVTRPSQDATMGFSQPTRVIEVLVKGGQTVKAGQLLVRGEDAEEAGRVRLQKLQAGTDLSVQRAQRTADLAKIEFEKLKEAGKGGAANPQEIDRARLTWEGADIDLSIAKMQKEQEQITVEMAQARVDRLQVKAPFDGQIDAVLYDVGQSLSETDKILRIVSIDPLYIDVPVPTDKVLRLKIKNGDPAWVLMQLTGEPIVHAGTVREVAPTADSASATVRVRVEVPNPTRIIAGLAAWVRFEEPTGVWRERVVRAPLAAQDGLSKQHAVAEFNAMHAEARRALALHDTVMAADIAVESRLTINRARSVLTQAEYQTFQTQVDELMTLIDQEKRANAGREPDDRTIQKATTRRTDDGSQARASK